MESVVAQVMAERGYVPALRFPDFGEDWKNYQLRDLANIYDGTHQTPDYVHEGVKFVSVENIYDLSATEKYITVDAYKKDFKIKPKKGDILMTRITAGIIGATAIVQNDNPLGFYVSLALIRRKSDVNINFLNQLISSFSFKRELHKRIIHVAFPKKINLGDIGDCRALTPSLSEQQKIGGFLSAVDDKIQQLTKKKALIEKYKQGVMQQIFSQQIRFKDDNGQNFPDWEEKTLADISVKKSSNIAANKIVDNFGEYIMYGASGFLKRVDFYREENEYISIIKDGAGVGRIFLCEGKSSVLGTMDIIKPKTSINIYFLYCILSNVDFIKYITGSTIPHIYFKDYSKENIGLPSIKEQIKIANFLTSIDDKIVLLTKQIYLAQQFKKSLLQQLFV
jgi:type I restriction enzyme S subunit